MYCGICRNVGFNPCHFHYIFCPCSSAKTTKSSRERSTTQCISKIVSWTAAHVSSITSVQMRGVCRVWLVPSLPSPLSFNKPTPHLKPPAPNSRDEARGCKRTTSHANPGSQLPKPREPSVQQRYVFYLLFHLFFSTNKQFLIFFLGFSM
jgi:hypothetical protein